jgi:hypothetical protein
MRPFLDALAKASPTRLVACAVPLLAALALASCAQVRPADRVPGETDTKVHKVSIVMADGTPVPIALPPLLTRLGQRAGSVIYTDRYSNPYRLAEDRRRVEVWFATLGYMDAVVAEPEVSTDAASGGLDITWKVTPGARYRWGEVVFTQVPPDTLAGVEGLAKAKKGGEVPDLEAVRVARYDMAAVMQRAGYGHARMIVRFHVDHETHQIHVTHLADPGPKTRIGQVTVTGANKVKAEDVIARAGLVPGEPFSLGKKEKAEVDLLDTGAFAAATAVTTADVEFYLGDVPDSGGVVPDDRVGLDGSLRPRALAETIDVDLRVPEAPAARIGLRVTGEIDPTRADVVTTATGDFRNALGSLRHLTARATVGYGLFARGDERDPIGLYGDGLLQITRPGLLGRLGDVRLAGRYRDQLLPGYHFREARVGPGLRTALSAKGFLDLEAVYRHGSTKGLDAITPDERARVSLPAGDTSHGLEIAGQLVLDGRDDPAEPMAGGLVALRGAFAPGGGASTHRYGLIAPELRGFLPLSPAVSFGLRASGGVIVGETSDGVPLGPRLFGGGAWGFRGFGRDRLSPQVTACDDGGACRSRVIGGLSLVEASAELRYLPPLGQTGLVAFVDAGGAGAGRNPFASGLNMAAGLGPRVRLWYLPISLDVSYHFLHDGDLGGHDILFFVRIGESF